MALLLIIILRNVKRNLINNKQDFKEQLKNLKENVNFDKIEQFEEEKAFIGQKCKNCGASLTSSVCEYCGAKNTKKKSN